MRTKGSFNGNFLLQFGKSFLLLMLFYILIWFLKLGFCYCWITIDTEKHCLVKIQNQISAGGVKYELAFPSFSITLLQIQFFSLMLWKINGLLQTVFLNVLLVFISLSFFGFPLPFFLAFCWLLVRFSLNFAFTINMAAVPVKFAEGEIRGSRIFYSAH